MRCSACSNAYAISDSILHASSKSGKKHWDEEWQNTDYEATKRLVARALSTMPASLSYYTLLRMIKRNAKRALACVELGCGSGTTSLLLKKLGIAKSACLVDASPAALRIAQRLFRDFGEECDLIQADARNTPFRNKAFDLSLSGGVIEHFRGAERGRIVAEHCRIAGSVALQVPQDCKAYWAYRNAVTLLNGGWPFGLEIPYRRAELASLFAQNGYGIVDVDYHNLLTSSMFVLAKKPVPKTILSSPFNYEIAVFASGGKK